MKKDSHFGEVNQKTDSDFFADLLVNYGAQVMAFKRVMADGNLSDTAEKYLKNTVLEKSGGSISLMLNLGATGVSAYDLLTKGSDRMLALFYSYLPDCCHGNMFHDVLEVCSTDYLGRLPQKFVFDVKYDIPWAKTAISYIQAEKSSPSSSSEIATYGSDIDLFVNYMKTYATQYKEGMAEYAKNGNKIAVSESDFTDGAGDKKIIEAVNNQAEVSNIPYYYHVAIRDAFAPYKVSGDQSLLDYLIATVTGNLSEEAMRKALFPVVKALGKEKLFSVNSCNMLGFLINTLMTSNEIAGAMMAIDRYRMDLEEGYGSKDLTVWVGSHKDLTDPGQYIAITSERVKDNLAADNYKKFSTNEIARSESLKASLIKCGIAGAVFLGSAIIFYGVSGLIVAITSAVMSSTAALTCMGICAATICAAVCSFMSIVSVVGLVLVVVVLLVFLILYLIEINKPEPDPVYTTIPTMMIDRSKDENNDLTDIAQYDVVRDPENEPADIHGFQSRGWLALYYTRDPSAGSPLTLGPNNSFFSYRKGASTVTDDKCVCLSKFLLSKAFNLNYDCYYDTIKGKYLFFYTEDSLAGKDDGVIKGKYIESILVATTNAKIQVGNRIRDVSEQNVQKYLDGKEGYEILTGVNFSPNSVHTTLVAFTTTNTPSNALTDIRAAYNTDAKQIGYGSVLYDSIFIGDDGMRKCPMVTCNEKAADRKSTSFSYGLYTTKDPRAGDPITTESLSIVTDLTKLEEGYEVVSYFAGVPLDFNSWDHEGKATFDSHCYMAFASDNPTTSDNEYVAGFGFFAGSEDWLTSKDSQEYNMEKYAQRSYGAKLIKTNFVPSFLEDEADRMFLGYVTTKNPKRALTDIAIFTGEPKSTYLPGNLTVGNYCYSACDVFTQGDYYFYGSGGDYRQRWIRPSHAYFTTVKSEVYDLDYDEWPEDTAIMPRALYGCGPGTGSDPIKVSDILYSTSSKSAPVNNSNSSSANSHLYRLSTGKSLDGEKDIGTGWKSVHAIDHYYYDEYDANGNLLSSCDLGLGIDNPTKDTTGTGHFYMYYKNGSVRRRGNYVSNIKLSGYTGGNAENNTYNMAVFSALAGAEDIINIDNPITLTDMSFNDFGTGKAAYYKTTTEKMAEKYIDGCFFVSVSYSDTPTNSVRSARVLEQVSGSSVLESKKKLPLYDSKSNITYDQTSMAVIEGKEGDMGKDGNAAYNAYAMYKSSSGYITNRVEVRFLGIVPGTPRSDTLSNIGSGAAEYYVGLNDSTDPFLFKNYSTGLAAAICLQSYNLDENGQNNDKYIESIAVAEAPSYDGDMEIAAAKLGAMGYPFAIDFDISEGASADGVSSVTALGIRRVDNPQKAVKDIRVSSDNLGENFDAGGIRYQRVNDKPVKLTGVDKDGVYLYVTYGASSDTVLWSDIVRNGTSLDKVDWFSLDYAEATRDPTFEETRAEYFAAHPGLSTSVNEYLKGVNATTQAQYGLRSDWEAKTALTNIGFIPSTNNSEQIVRRIRHEAHPDDAPDIKVAYWAGCSAYKDDKLLVPVTNDIVQHHICTFTGTETSVGLRFTNMGNEPFKPFNSDNAGEEGVSASVFSGRNIWIIVILSAVFLAGLAAAYIIYCKKRKNALMHFYIAE